MKSPPWCYAAPAQRRPMVLMSRREPLLVKKGLPPVRLPMYTANSTRQCGSIANKG
jgi:hypothetical protein